MRTKVKRGRERDNDCVVRCTAEFLRGLTHILISIAQTTSMCLAEWIDQLPFMLSYSFCMLPTRYLNLTKACTSRLNETKCALYLLSHSIVVVASSSSLATMSCVSFLSPTYSLLLLVHTLHVMCHGKLRARLHSSTPAKKRFSLLLKMERTRDTTRGEVELKVK